MAAQKNHAQVPKVRFRVLIIGRANAGKTSILQRVCDTTESPEIYRLGRGGTRHRVRPSFEQNSRPHHLSRSHSILRQRLDKLILVSDGRSREFYLQRGNHNVEDELIFTNHDGYVFHDSRGFESGSEVELKIVQEFVHRKSRERRLKDRLHAIWFVISSIYSFELTRLLSRYCIPMDNDRPGLDLKHFEDICPDKNGTSMSKYK